MTNTRIATLIAVPLTLIALAGCGAAKDEPSTGSSKTPAQTTSASPTPTEPAKAEPCDALSAETVKLLAHTGDTTPNDTGGAEGDQTQISCSYLGGKDDRDVVWAASYGPEAQKLVGRFNSSRSIWNKTIDLGVPGMQGYISDFSSMRPFATAFAHWGDYAVMATVGGEPKSVDDPAINADLRVLVNALRSGLKPEMFQ